MSNFYRFLPHLLKNEGYYSNRTADKGGETYRGISRRYHPSWTGWTFVDQEKRKMGGRLPWNHRINNPLLDKLIEKFYKRNFWDGFMIDHIRDANIQHILFDQVVNSGGYAIKSLQRVLRESFGKKLVVDGAIGPKTIEATNSVDPRALFEAYKKKRENYYDKLGDKQPDNKDGWLARIRRFEYRAIGISLAGIAVAGVAVFF